MVLSIPIVPSKVASRTQSQHKGVCLHACENQPMPSHTAPNQQSVPPSTLSSSLDIHVRPTSGRRGLLSGLWDGVFPGKPGLVLGHCVTGFNVASSKTPVEIHHFLYFRFFWYAYGDGPLLCVSFCMIERAFGYGKWCLPYCRNESGLYFWREFS